MWRKRGRGRSSSGGGRKKEKKARDSQRFYLRVNNLKERQKAEGEVSGKRSMTLPSADPQPETLSARSEREINLVIRMPVRNLGRRAREREEEEEGGRENKHVPVLKRSS